ncbi:MAG: glycine oxidase ThiO, partial [Bradymonadaceae bacterium]|nr:glycine oxidase ThiO [Lujinxingiaceae bacterium]
RARAGDGASRAAAGMLAPSAEVDFDDAALLDLQRQSLALYPEFVRELEEHSGSGLEYRADGTLVVALTRDDDEAVERVYRHQASLGLHVARLDNAEVQRLEPGLSRVYSAVLCAGDHQVNNSHIVDALLTAFFKEGGTLSEGAEVVSVHLERGRARGVTLANGTLIRASNVLIAAGAWSPGIENVPELTRHAVRPVRGQMIALDAGTPALLTHVVRGPDAYLVPKNDGSLIVGSTMEERGFEAKLTAGGVHDLLRGALRILPALYEQPVRDMWTGFRPVSRDSRPLLGPSVVNGLWLATGHARHGILLAPITAQIMAEMIHTGRVPAFCQPFSPARML